MQNWPHAPIHLLSTKGCYMVTGATLNKQLFFQKETHLDLLQNTLFELAKKYQWQLKAWAIFPNHYHFIAESPSDPQTLRSFITHLHASSARALNKLEETPGRTIWFQFWDTQISYHNSYYARMNYVMQNPVKHGIVKEAEDYPWCSMNWFKHHSGVSQKNTILSFKTDKITVVDDF